MPEARLVSTVVDQEWAPEALHWAQGLVVKLPDTIVAVIKNGTTAARSTDSDSELRAMAADLRMRRAFLMHPPASARLPINYRALWGPLRRGIAGAMGRAQRLRQSAWADFPGWPIDLSADVAADVAGVSRPLSAGPTPVLLTHDIDSPEGLANLVEMFLPIEEAAGARSANYVVPCAWPVSSDLVEAAISRGHEIGVHGYDHSNRTPFLPAGERRTRLEAGRAFGDRFGAVGYRAPSLARTQALLDDLAPLYSYDSSIPTSGGPFPAANNGCATARPWRLGDLWEIPLSLPRDGSLRFLGHSPQTIARMWMECADIISRSGGVVTLLTHCERGFSGNPAMLSAYETFLGRIAADPRFAFMLPRELVQRLDSERRQ